MRRYLIIVVILLLFVSPSAGRSKKGRPIIGITATSKKELLSVNNKYAAAVAKAGGIPFVIAPIDDEALLSEIVGMLDGILFSGGEDVNPARYQETPHPMLGEVIDLRDTYELMLFRLASQRDMPIFGICRGMQLINVALGGSLYQDIPSEFNTDIIHRQTRPVTQPAHSIRITKDTESYRVIQQEEIGVNSLHHQCIKRPGKGVKITAWSPDSVPEMMECYPEKRILCMQSHPEISTINNDDPIMFRFFQKLIDEARVTQKKHKRK